jgi:CheY-like chemotaxis protein
LVVVVARSFDGEGPMDVTKVLVVDDSKLLHRMYEMMLKGKTLVFALDGIEAIERLGEHPDVDLVLLDINMPRMSGLECLAHLKAHPIL